MGSKPAGRPPHRVVAALVYAFFLWMLAEIAVAAFFLVSKPEWERMRLTMLGLEKNSPALHRMIGQPYLQVVPMPGYSNNLGIQHNQQGYRGEAVPVRRRPGYVRILCLGGSTTYGWKVWGADETYPAQLKALLEQELPPGVKGVEMINAGVPTGCCAEVLTHYHFKFHYYQPDLVIINTGGNDASAMDSLTYQPDYSHWRRQLNNVYQLPPQSRWMAHSRVLTVLILWLFRSEYISGQSYLWPLGHTPDVVWFPDPAVRPVAERDVAFTHHLNSVLDEIARDGHRVLLVPFRATKLHASEVSRTTDAEVARNEQRLRRVAAERKILVAPFPESCIAPASWEDYCHLNAAGCREKAAHILPYARHLLWPDRFPAPG